MNKKPAPVRALTCLSGLVLIGLSSCTSRQGQLLTCSLDAPSLAQNQMRISHRQQLAVYLPPSYHQGQRRYPVLYFLPNFNVCLWRYTGGDFQGFRLRPAMDKLIRQGVVREMIVVIPNAVDWLGSGWYRNSPLTGNWEDYVVRDVVDYVDRNFRTIPTAAARGLAGHGVGGTGALELALKHPDRFGCLYAMSPALFGPQGLKDSGLFDDHKLQAWQSQLRHWKDLDEDARRKQFRDYVQTRLNSPSRERSFEGLAVSYALTVAPDLNLPYPHIALPGPGPHNQAETALIRRYENGLGDWSAKIAAYFAKGHSLRAITIECGREGEYPWIQHGAAYLSALLQQMGVSNQCLTHEGGHDTTLGRRLLSAMLPAMSAALRDSP